MLGEKMSNSKIAKRLLKIKRTLNDLEQKHTKITGQIEFLEKELKKYNVSSVEELENRIIQNNKKLTIMEEEQEKEIKKLEKQIMRDE
jgi:uncharacterized protein YlxW (UPF0749 family)